MARTKLICTLGPASATPKMVQGLVRAGASVFRLNFSHGTPEEHARMVELIREAEETTGKPLTTATVHSRMLALRAFVRWLASQPGYKSVNYADADFFNLSANDSRVATASRERPVPSIAQINHVIGSIECRNDIDRRDQALISFTLVSGMRDNAIASLHLGHVDLERRTIFQDARAVRTKNRKTFTSDFFPVSIELS